MKQLMLLMLLLSGVITAKEAKERCREVEVEETRVCREVEVEDFFSFALFFLILFFFSASIFFSSLLFFFLSHFFSFLPISFSRPRLRSAGCAPPSM